MMSCRFAVDPLAPPRHAWGPRAARSAGLCFRHGSREENSHSQQPRCLPRLQENAPSTRPCSRDRRGTTTPPGVETGGRYHPREGRATGP
jgi:hypothetical protein